MRSGDHPRQILTQNQLFPTALPDFVQQTGDTRTLACSATLSPGKIRSGIFHENVRGLWGLTDQASFAAATFAGLFVGSAVLGSFADRFGRRTIFIFSMLWYSVTLSGWPSSIQPLALMPGDFSRVLALGWSL